MNHRRSVTVIVPVYRTEPYLAECLQSLVDQTYTDFRIAVVDDGSPGDCEEIVRTYQAIRPNIAYIRLEENRGTFYAHVLGVRQSSSDYVAFLDSDDTARSHFIETLIKAADETGADIVGCSTTRQNSGNFSVEGTENVVNALGSRRIPNHKLWCKLFKRRLFEQSPELDELAERRRVIFEDLVITTTIFTKAKSYYHVDDVLVNYTKDRIDSVSNDISLKKLYEQAKALPHFAEHLAKTLNKFEDVRTAILERSLGFFYARKLHRVDLISRDRILSKLLETSHSQAMLLVIAKMADSRLRITRRKLKEYRAKAKDLHLACERLKSRNRYLRERLRVAKQKVSHMKEQNSELRKSQAPKQSTEPSA